MQMFQFRGQRYRYNGTVEVTTKAGKTVSVFDFTGLCATCGKVFQFTASRSVRTPMRRCIEHARKGVRVRPSEIHEKARVSEDENIPTFEDFLAEHLGDPLKSKKA